MPKEIRPNYIAYFSMEVGLDSAMPTYSGGLGVLAGDTLRAAADLSLPMIGVTLLHRKGYFRQTLDRNGNQTESPVDWDYEEALEPMVPRPSCLSPAGRWWFVPGVMSCAASLAIRCRSISSTPGLKENYSLGTKLD